jgi:hypothetical protein
MASCPTLSTARASPLHSKPRFLALSYTWGRPGPHFPAEYGNGSRKVIKLSGDFFLFNSTCIPPSILHMLQSEFEAGTRFWIDVICINQSSIQERNQQVALMRDTYSTASSGLGLATLNPKLPFAGLGAVMKKKDRRN